MRCTNTASPPRRERLRAASPPVRRGPPRPRTSREPGTGPVPSGRQLAPPRRFLGRGPRADPPHPVQMTLLLAEIDVVEATGDARAVDVTGVEHDSRRVS